jgi:AcrR family transcriptional regulator
MPRASRAYGREDKQARREIILAAAADLFGQRGGELPSVATIAGRAGLAKGTVYLYFPTRETIFATLLLDGWRAVLRLAEETFASANTPREQTVDRFLRVYVAHLHGHRDLLRLDALRPMLEQNLVPETLATSRQTFQLWLATSGAAIDRKMDLASGRGLAILTRTHALTCGLWRQTGVDPPDGSTPSAPPFSDELADALREYWRGALASP